MIRIAIVEDERLYADQLTEYMDRFMKETGEQIRLTFSATEKILRFRISRSMTSF